MFSERKLSILSDIDSYDLNELLISEYSIIVNLFNMSYY